MVPVIALGTPTQSLIVQYIFIYCIYVLVLAGGAELMGPVCVVESPPYNSLVLAICKIGSTPLHPFAYHHTPFILTMEVP